MVDLRTAPLDEDYGEPFIPPHAIGAEQAVLGGLLHDNRSWDRIYDVVSERDFYRETHRVIWRAIERQIEANKPADAVLVASLVDGELRQYVHELWAETPSAVNIRQHAQLVRDKSILRSLIAAGSEITESAREHAADPQEAAERAEALVLGVMDRNVTDAAREPVTIYQAVSDAIDWLDADRAAGIPTGYTALDAMLAGGGLQPEQFVIIAGRPSMGKSALSYCIAEHAAVAGKSVAYFALETSRREIGVRAVRWHEGKLGRAEALSFFHALPLVIDDSPAVGLSHIRVRLRRIRRQRGLHLVIVDYLQLMRHRSESRLQEVSEISRGLKAIAKEFQVPVIAVAQLNRQTEARTDRRPLLSDLRESGQIEQDADTIMMVYREAYYDANAKHMEGYGEVFVRKNRDGQTGEALLRWDGPRTRWIDYTGDRPVKAGGNDAALIPGDSNRVRPFKPRGDDAA